MRALREAQKLGCSGAHQNNDGRWMPCSSHDKLTQVAPVIASASRDAISQNRGKRTLKGSNKIKKQWENLGQSGILNLGNVAGGGLVAGSPTGNFGGDAAGMSAKALPNIFGPRDQDVDVFTDIESARQRSRQLGCVGVSRRISKTGATVWMPCTNMSDYSSLAGTTSLGRRHQKERLERVINAAIEKKLKKNNKRNKKSLAGDVNFKALGGGLGGNLKRPAFFDPNAWDGDNDGRVQDNTPFERPSIPGVNGLPVSGMRSVSKPRLNIDEAQRESIESGDTAFDELVFSKKAKKYARKYLKLFESTFEPIDEKYRYMDDDEIIDLIRSSMPASAEELKQLVRTNPFTKNKARTAWSRLMQANPDFEATAKMRDAFIKQIKDNPGVLEMVRRYGVPPIVATEYVPALAWYGNNTEGWGESGGGWAHLGVIAMNYTWVEFDHGMSIEDAVRHEMGHAWEAMAAVQNDKARAHYALQFSELYEGLIQMSRNKEQVSSYHDAKWGNESEHASAAKISEYATTARIEWLAETIAALTSSDPSKRAKVDATAKENISESFGIAPWEVEQIFTPIDGSGGFASRISSLPNKRDLDNPSLSDFLKKRYEIDEDSLSESAKWVEQNPEYLSDMSLSVQLSSSPGVQSQYRRSVVEGFRSYNSQGRQGSGGREMGQKILGRVNPEESNQDEPTLYFVGGTTGSGKSTLVARGVMDGVPNQSSAAHIDPDEIKTGLVGWNGGQGASAVHQASRVATDKIMDDAALQRMHMVVQGTGKRREHLTNMRRRGYKTSGHFVWIPDDLADQRVAERKRNGGANIPTYFGSQIARELRSGPDSVSRQITDGLYDEFFLYDNSGDVPKLVAKRLTDGSFEILNNQVFNSFFSPTGAKFVRDYWESNSPSNKKNLTRTGMSSRRGLSSMGDKVGMRSRRLGEWEDVTDYDKFGESSIVLKNTYGEDSLRDLLEILESEQSSIKKAIAHWEKTGEWLGEDFNVSMPRTPNAKSGITKNHTAESLLKNQTKEQMKNNFDLYLNNIDAQLKHVRGRLKNIEEINNGAEPLHINFATLRDMPDFDALVKRGKEINNLRYGDENPLISDDYIYLTHTGHPELENGILDPNFSLDAGGGGIPGRGSMDTKRLNKVGRDMIVRKYETAEKDLTAWQEVVDHFSKTGEWRGAKLAKSLQLGAQKPTGRIFNDYSADDLDNKISSEYLLDQASNSIDFNKEVLQRLSKQYGPAKRNEEHLSYEFAGSGPNFGYSRRDTPSSKTYLVRVPRDEATTEAGPSTMGEFQVFGQLKPVASFEFPSNINDWDTNAAATAYFEKIALKNEGIATSGMRSRNQLGQSIEKDEIFGGSVFSGFTPRNPLTTRDLNNNNLRMAEMISIHVDPRIDFKNRNMDYANLTRAHLGGIDLTESSLFSSNLSNLNGSGVIFGKTNSKPADLRYSILSAAQMPNSQFEGVDLSGALMISTNFNKANLKNTNFENAVLWNSDFRGADLRGSNITVEQLMNSKFDSTTKLPEGMSLPIAENNGTNTQKPSTHKIPLGVIGNDDADLLRKNLVDGVLKIDGPLDAKKLELLRRNLSKSEIFNTDLRRSTFNESTFFNSTMANVDLTGSSLFKSNFNKSTLNNIKFSHANLVGANFRNAIIGRNVSFKGANLTDANFADAKIQGKIDLSGADLTGAILDGVDLRDAIVDSQTKLDGAIGLDRNKTPKMVVRGLRSRNYSDMSTEDLINTPGNVLLSDANDALLEIGKMSNAKRPDANIDPLVSKIQIIYGHLNDVPGINEDFSIKNSELDNQISAVNNIIDQFGTFQFGDGQPIDVRKFIENKDKSGYVKAIKSSGQNVPLSIPINEWNKINSQLVARDMLNDRKELLSPTTKIVKSKLNSSVATEAMLSDYGIMSNINNLPDFSIAEPIRKKRPTPSIASGELGPNEMLIYNSNNRPTISKIPKSQRIEQSINRVNGMASRSKPTSETGRANRSEEIYKTVSDALIAALEESVDGNWERPWNLGTTIPRNASTGRQYGGFNVILFSLVQQNRKYEHPVWATYKQWEALGAQVQRGERGLTGIKWVSRERDVKLPDGTPTKDTFLTPSAFTVFNIAQVTGANPDDFLPPRLSPEERIPALEEIFGQILPNIKTINGDSAYYSPASDYINMPPFSAFNDPSAYYATLSHELIHWTGNKKRADRPNMNRFGTPEYAFEELVAEIGSAYLMALLGMEATPQKQHAQYLKSWIEILKDDPTAIQRAASQAQKAVDYLIAQSPKLQELSTPINISQNLVEEA
jgi:antirestriction protein ArdC/uncharacterized protein YjbI with pentapeptide repeats/predicted ABC-type ATPase